MISLYKDYLIGILRTLDLKNIYDDLDDLKRRHPSPSAFIYISDREDIEKDGQLVGYEDDLENKFRRYKKRKYKITNYVTVLFVSRSQAKAEQLKINFLKALDDRIFDNENNPILLSPYDSTLHLNESILNDKSGREILIEFVGGVFTERLFKLVDGFNPNEREIVN